jgi:hypothetical protein
MKADIFPPTPRLDIPSWVPKPVARMGRGIDRRFLHDPRMRNVWGPLSKRRCDGTFMHPASASVLAANEEERQGRAMAELLHYVVVATISPGTITTRSKAEQKRKRLLAKAEQLRADAETWLRNAPAAAPFELWSDDYGPDPCWRRLVDASQAYEEMAAESYAADMRFVLDRARGDGDVRWFALAVAHKCRALFGSPMYGITAILTSVALERKISQRSVREWFGPAVKPQKISP